MIEDMLREDPQERPSAEQIGSRVKNLKKYTKNPKKDSKKKKGWHYLQL